MGPLALFFLLRRKTCQLQAILHADEPTGQSPSFRRRAAGGKSNRAGTQRLLNREVFAMTLSPESCNPGSSADSAGCDDKTLTPTMSIDMGTPQVYELRQLGPYRIEEQIGRGAMGTVYRAEHQRLKRKVALKVVPPELTLSAKRLKRFQREMEAVGRLDHPNIVRATDAGDDRGVHYLAMELIEGIDLDRKLEMAGRFPIGCACEVALQTAVGLEHIRQHGLVHRDIKPSNLLLTQEGVVKILDLGIAMLRHDDQDSSVTTLGALMGTPDFIAPEQVRHAGAVDSRADIYSLGCTLYMLLAGTPPFGGPDHATHIAKMIAHTNTTAKRLDEISPEFSAELADIVAKMMAKAPEERYQSPQEVVAALQPWAESQTLRTWLQADSATVTTARELAPLPPAAPPARRGFGVLDNARLARVPWPATVAAGCVAVACVTLPWWLVGGGLSAPQQDSANLVPAPTSPESQPALLPTAITATASRDLPDQDPSPSSQALGQVAADTAVIREHTEHLTASSRSIDQNTQRIADTLDGIQAAFVTATQSGGLIEQPDTVVEFYHNARTYEQLNDPQRARQCYMDLFARGGDFVDIHEHFQQQLRLQEGVAGARALYRDLPGNRTTPVRELARALLADLPERETLLLTLLEQYPDFAPAMYELSRCTAYEQVGTQTLAEKAAEKERLENFLTLAREGEYLRYFVEAARAATKVADAEQRLAALKEFSADIIQRPVSITFRRFSRGWNLTFQIQETAREIQYRVDADSEWKSTGDSEYLDPQTQQLRPNSLVSLPISTPAGAIEVAYVDLRGVRRGPFAIPFDPAAELLTNAKRELAARQQSWLKFARSRAGEELQFNYLAVYRDVIRQVHFALDDDQPTTEFTLPNLQDPQNQPASVPVPADTRFAVVKITFADGTESETVRVDR